MSVEAHVSKFGAAAAGVFKQKTEPLVGSVDFANRDRLIGWAFQPQEPDAPVRLEVMYGDEFLLAVVANESRPDVALAGYGNGNCGFDVRLPAPEGGTNHASQIYVRRASDKAIFWRPGKLLVERTPGIEVDLLASPFTHTVNLEFTSRCNLRCVYCAVSQPGYDGLDMDIPDFDGFVQQLKARRVRVIMVCGHGETTMIPGWHVKVMGLAAAGFGLSIISNFARLLEEEELETMARISKIMISIDTHRPEVQRLIRRRVDIGNILINMHRVTATASRLGLPKPSFTWSGVVTDKVALDLVDYIRFGLACGVRHFILCNLSKYEDVPDATNVQHVTTLPDHELRRFVELLYQARTIVEDADGILEIYAGLGDTAHSELARREAA